MRPSEIDSAVKHKKGLWSNQAGALSRLRSSVKTAIPVDANALSYLLHSASASSDLDVMVAVNDLLVPTIATALSVDLITSEDLQLGQSRYNFC